MKLKLSETLARLNLLLKVGKLVFGTKNKTVFNKVADGVEKAKKIKDFLKNSPDETL